MASSEPPFDLDKQQPLLRQVPNNLWRYPVSSICTPSRQSKQIQLALHSIISPQQIDGMTTQILHVKINEELRKWTSTYMHRYAHLIPAFTHYSRTNTTRNEANQSYNLPPLFSLIFNYAQHMS